MNRQLLQEISNPPAVYRGKPFWAWNGELEPQELRRQIRILKRMGLGGFFMHSRVGLNTPYLAKEWFGCVDACIDEAEKQGMEAWIYDEDRWPSGAAGGLVTRDKRYRMRSVCAVVHTDPSSFRWTGDTLAAFVLSIHGSVAGDIERLPQGRMLRKLPSGKMLLSFTLCINGDSDWYNGQSYLDTMNPEAVREFITVTHSAYQKRYGNKFGKSIPGIFTDEPNYGSIPPLMNPQKGVSFPWTDKLPVVFSKRYGYDIIERLPELLFDIDGQTGFQGRYHYHECITFLFVDSFAKQIGQWCATNNILFTGHVLGEETPSSQTRVVGSAMRSYEFMQAPGIDLLTEHNREYDTAKQASSVARQFGSKWRLTETYGCTGWDFNFAGHKALGDWQVALGINLRCQHLSWYTMQGEAKRDYPAGIFYHSPWWELYPLVEDYFARIHAVMTRGEEVRDILVIHPVESTWILCKHGWDRDEMTAKFDRSIVEVRDTLLSGHLDFDYGDEEIIARHGKVVRGKTGPEFTINKGRYKAVVVPPMLTMRGTTFKLLQAFRKSGGLVVFAGEPSRMLDALPSHEITGLVSSCTAVPCCGSLLVDSLKTVRRISISDERGHEIAPALYLLREDTDSFYLFICNTSMVPEQMKPVVHGQDMVRNRTLAFSKVNISGLSEAKGQPLELDPSSGVLYTAETKRNEKKLIITSSFPVLGSRLFIIPKRSAAAPAIPKRPAHSMLRATSIKRGRWPVMLSECNNLVLDRPAFSIGNELRRGPEEILKIDRAVRTVLGCAPRGGRMKQPWAREKVVNPRKTPVELTYSFDVDVLPGGDLFLAVEQPQAFAISLNGMPVDTDTDCGWWTDKSLRKLRIDPAQIRFGRNEIVMHLDYTEEFSGLEIMYLLGSFGAAVKGTEVSLVAPPMSLRIGDWVGQGLPFYSGSVTYCTTIRNKHEKGQRLFIEIAGYRGTAVRVFVNGSNAGIIAWHPEEVDITEYLKEGENDIRIEVIGHRRNSHGPHHHKEKWPHWTGPGQYQSSDDMWFEGYNLVPCGLMQSPGLVSKTVA